MNAWPSTAAKHSSRADVPPQLVAVGSSINGALFNRSVHDTNVFQVLCNCPSCDGESGRLLSADSILKQAVKRRLELTIKRSEKVSHSLSWMMMMMMIAACIFNHVTIRDHNRETVVSLYTLYCVRFNETTVLTVKSTDLCLVFIKQPQNASTDIN